MDDPRKFVWNPCLILPYMDYTMVHMMKVAIHEAKAKLSALIKAALAGEQGVIVKSCVWRRDQAAS